jgi:hypothetical protein
MLQATCRDGSEANGQAAALRRTRMKANLFALALLMASGPVSAQSFVGPSGKPLHKAKCNMAPISCYQQASELCGGKPYQILDSESHRGGLIADVLPGPVVWYSMTFSCGSSDGQLARFPFRDNRRMPVFAPPPRPTAAPPPSMTNCSRIGNSVTCYSN